MHCVLSALGECQASDMYVEQLRDTIRHSVPKGKLAAFFAEPIQVSLIYTCSCTSWRIQTILHRSVLASFPSLPILEGLGTRLDLSRVRQEYVWTYYQEYLILFCTSTFPAGSWWYSSFAQGLPQECIRGYS